MSEVADQILESTQVAVPETIQAQPNEAAPADQAPKDDEKISSKLELLIRREKSAWERERSAKAREAELEARLAKINEFESVKTNPKKALDLLGIDYNTLTKHLLDEDPETNSPELEIKKLREELDQYRNSQDEEKKKQQEELKKQAEARENELIQNFKSEIGEHLTKNKDRYELILFEGYQDEVFELIDKNYIKTRDAEAKKLEEEGKDPSEAKGVVMSIADAADKIEKYLEDKYSRGKEVGKIKALWNILPQQAKQELAKMEMQKQQPRTLTNQMSATPTQRRHTPMNDEERIQKAIAYARGLRPSVN